MNRAIKFRVWDESIEKIVTCGDDRRWGTITNHYLLRNFHDEFLMQFTGLKDKNGKEIYEGDILDWHGDLYKVYYWQEMATFQLEDLEGGMDDYFESGNNEVMEVVGNIFEDSELLEKEEA